MQEKMNPVREVICLIGLILKRIHLNIFFGDSQFLKSKEIRDIAELVTQI